MKLLLAVIWCTSLGGVASAQIAKVISGEITYSDTAVQQNTYDLKMTLLCWTDTTDSFCWQEMVIDLGDGNVDTAYNVAGPDSCGLVIANPGCGKKIYQNEFVVRHTYPGPGSYQLWAEYILRVIGIVNIPNSENTNFYLFSDLVINVFNGGNHSSDFSAYSFVEGYVDSCTVYNPGVINADNDSLTFSLVPCVGAGGNPIVGYLYPDEVAAGANNVLTLDSTTGELTWCSSQMPGLYSVCMLQKEYNSSVYNGSVLREIMFCIDGTISVEELEGDNASVKIYPNPVTSQFTISGIAEYPAQLTLFDLTGRVVKQASIENEQQPINISTLPKGLYVWQLDAARGKLVVDKQQKSP